MTIAILTRYGSFNENSSQFDLTTIGVRTMTNDNIRHEATAAIARDPSEPLTFEQVTLQSPRADEVLIKIVASGICHTDLVCLYQELPVPLPMVLGHEGAGIVVEAGSAVKDLSPGDHVVLSFNSCGECPSCEHELPSYCYDFMENNFSGCRGDGTGTMEQNGEAVNANFFGQSSFATMAIANVRNTVKVRKDLPLEMLAPLGCGVQTGAGTVLNSLSVTVANSMAIFGGGAVGLSALMAAKLVGADPIVVVEPLADRRALALELGADHVIDPFAVENVVEEIKKLVGGVDFSLEMTGIPAVASQCVAALKPLGTCALVGAAPADAEVSINIMEMLATGRKIVGIVEGDAEPRTFIPQLIEYYDEGRFPFDRLIDFFPFEALNEAVEAQGNGQSIKPVVRMG
ncbi:NAD(P)-dependent alcohol dehydrogenase [Thalassotalea fonticola]|uniref:NAD(P)-dependent alcohol dehydrogenase n=1 Tax=Thalassotalea fonticola TaxID=3065649 RepID=A0ABZ0GQX7_9GAMM|nr:NAD(P)-dependent alcohol dehydrogenase [Colwelliaceae bacterium S1-1]